MNIYAAGFCCAKSAWEGVLHLLSGTLTLAQSPSERSAFWDLLLHLNF